MNRIITAEDLEDYDEEIEPIYCPLCLNAGYKVNLGRRVLMPGEPKPEDYYDWLQCPKCFWIHHLSTIPMEEEITNAVETVDNPYDNKTTIESVYQKRNFSKNKTGKPITKKRRRKKKNVLHEDPEIDALMRIYGERVKVIYDSSP